MAKNRKKAAKIYTLPGVERRDIGLAVEVGRVLDGAKKAGLSDLVLVGIDREGRLYVAGSMPDIDKAAGMLMRGVCFTAGATMAPVRGLRLA
ncbi:MAG: hypothetical protein AABZ67_00605 [Pseudomonadota bacterium]